MSAATAASMQALSPTFAFIPLALIAESELNPRKTFPAAGLADLTQSIRESGVWTPITVRPLPERFYVSSGMLSDSSVRYVAVKNIVGRENLLHTFSAGTTEENEADAWLKADELNTKESKYEIAAGHRRFRAAKAAGLADIPAIVRTMTDQEFAELITFENLGREDVHPLEEAAGFEKLIRDYAYSAATIAEKIGCHESYVHKRLRLARLVGKAREAFANGEITLKHAVLIARLEPEQQKEAFALCFQQHWNGSKQVNEVVSAQSLDLRIREKIFLNLSAAPWKKDDPALVPKVGACTVCPKRTGANNQLFDDMPKGDNCLDRDCFDKKRQAFIRITTAAHLGTTGKPMARVATSWCSDTKKLDCLQDHSYTVVKAKDRCPHVEKAIAVYGNNTGQILDICVAAKCPKHGNSLGGQYGGYRRSAQELAAEQKRKTDAKIDAAYRSALWLKTWQKLQLDCEMDQSEVTIVAHYLIERIDHDGRGPLVKVLGLKAGPKKSSVYEDANSGLLREYFATLGTDAQTGFLLALAIAPALGSMYTNSLKKLEQVASTYLVSPSALKKEIASPILAKAKTAAGREKLKAASEKKTGRKRKASPAEADDPDNDSSDAETEDEE